MISLIPIILISFLEKSSEVCICLASCWKTPDSCSRPTRDRTYWLFTIRKQYSVKRRECQNHSNRRLKLAESVQIAATITTFIRLLLMLQITQLPSRTISISCRKDKFFSSLTVHKFFPFILHRAHFIALHDMHFALQAK